MNSRSTNNFLNYSNKPNRFKCEDSKQQTVFANKLVEPTTNPFLTNKNARVQSSIKNKGKLDYEIKDTDFPELYTNSKQIKEQSLPTNYSFKTAVSIPDAVYTANNCENDNIIVEPGWVQIHSVNNQPIFKYGSNVNIKQQVAANINDTEYDMNNAITTMSTNWKQYRTTYDEINGEGMYDDIHYLSPSYEDTSESETELDKDNDSECSE